MRIGRSNAAFYLEWRAFGPGRLQHVLSRCFASGDIGRSTDSTHRSRAVLLLSFAFTSAIMDVDKTGPEGNTIVPFSFVRGVDLISSRRLLKFRGLKKIWALRVLLL